MGRALTTDLGTTLPPSAGASQWRRCRVSLPFAPRSHRSFRSLSQKSASTSAGEVGRKACTTLRGESSSTFRNSGLRGMPYPDNVRNIARGTCCRSLPRCKRTSPEPEHVNGRTRHSSASSTPGRISPRTGRPLRQARPASARPAGRGYSPQPLSRQLVMSYPHRRERRSQAFASFQMHTNLAEIRLQARLEPSWLRCRHSAVDTAWSGGKTRWCRLRSRKTWRRAGFGGGCERVERGPLVWLSPQRPRSIKLASPPGSCPLRIKSSIATPPRAALCRR